MSKFINWFNNTNDLVRIAVALLFIIPYIIAGIYGGMMLLLFWTTGVTWAGWMLMNRFSEIYRKQNE